MQFGTMCIALAILAASPVLAHAGRYELISEPDIRHHPPPGWHQPMSSTRGPASFWICTARYSFQDLTADNGDYVRLSADIGRPSLTETSDVRAVTRTTAIGAFLAVFWFIEPTSGEVQFCAVRHAGLCVRMNLP